MRRLGEARCHARASGHVDTAIHTNGLTSDVGVLHERKYYAGNLGGGAEAAYRNVLRTTNWKASGLATAYFYNPPWTIPFLRRNEIVIPVESEQR
jgi:hypothetical protein